MVARPIGAPDRNCHAFMPRWTLDRLRTSLERSSAVTPELLSLYCPTCARECLAEAPPCQDGHGDGCPDRACVHCGTALLLDVALFQLAHPRSGARHAA
jgi:hypothetical protein